MDEKKIEAQIQEGRTFLKTDGFEVDEDYETDQQLGKKQPPLVKAPMREERIVLPKDFDHLDMENDFLKVINTRRSHRVYCGRKMKLLELSCLLWCAQGIEGIRGKSYATLRTVPCGGARHEFECYLIIQNTEGLKDGLYHYLPWYHALECLKEMDDLKEVIDHALDEQIWAEKANVIFLFSYVCYRAEWRYGVGAARMIMADVGHIGENLYLACTSMHLGGCGVGALDGTYCDALFNLDGKEEFMLYAMPVGTIDEKDAVHEDDIYAFVKEQGL
ncbi:MAG: SagB/ThcOx family dehydrogenase [Solobacterium sp.]|jgi:SagB-type dehydrogenase family enzyme|nr:SagB/ThcOx family dehydrogenase [Solobacterium sp.]MCH4048650.1 SagB/ThcOx family dehydrogenase [Solobacterium sp.]MCH4075659.1 SagB/ThcOx family dehydrogenase [Solobacterium sp.]MCI1314672.1 SagB/ThcOx family dehydrogenase [Solobacterium sp.]MCI1346925.1 SagB/ThcOx family dehydrogenase [Solobacterium sp.]